MTLGPWTDAQFSEMSWHDNHIHGIRLVAGEQGSGELLLDIDYIVEWLQGATGFQFRIVPATLRFREVTDLRVDINYAAITAAMGPISIDGIHRRNEQRTHYLAQCWNIPVNFPAGEISFEAAGFEQVAWGREVLSGGQALQPYERKAA